MPWSIVIWISGLIVLMVVLMIVRKRSRRYHAFGLTIRQLEERDLCRAERCERCGYDLTMIDSVRCPECGEVRLYPQGTKVTGGEEGV